MCVNIFVAIVLKPRFKIDVVIMIICSIVIIIISVLTLQVSTAKPMIADLVESRLRSSTLDSLHTGVSPGNIGCAYTYSGPFRVRADI